MEVVLKKKARQLEASQNQVQRRMAVWKAVSGIWKGRRGPEPVKYQRSIRRDRKQP